MWHAAGGHAQPIGTLASAFGIANTYYAPQLGWAKKNYLKERMKIMKSNKKMMLVAGAVATSLLLTAGATLMFFSATTDTATNVLTFGNLAADGAIQLWEKGGQIHRNNDTAMFDNLGYIHYDKQVIIDKSAPNYWEGFDWSKAAVIPGDVLDKAPYVKNTGTVPVFVKMLASFTVKDADGNDAKFEDLEANNPNFDLGTLFNYVWSDKVANRHFAEDWQAGQPNTDGDALTVSLYYAENNALKILNGGGTMTSPVFEEIHIPTDLESLQGYTLDLKLTAYVTQSDNRGDGTGTTADWDAMFK